MRSPTLGAPTVTAPVRNRPTSRSMASAIDALRCRLASAYADSRSLSGASIDRACSKASAIVVAGIVRLGSNLGVRTDQWVAGTLSASKPRHPIHSAYRHHDVKASLTSDRES